MNGARAQFPVAASLALAVTLTAACGGVGAAVPAESARADNAVRDLGPGTMPDFVEIPGGAFTMGADAARDSMAFDNERWSSGAPQGTIHVDTFYLARHEVTVAQFAAYAAATNAAVDARALSGRAAHPVAFVSWPDALAYGRWLEATLKSAPATPPQIRERLQAGWRITLPTEAEWEKAARGGDGRRFPWGDEPRRDRANYENTATTPVGQYPCPECAYGLADMSGNVWEWTRSPNQPYPYAADDDRSQLEADALWVMRGGSFGDGARLLRTTVRGAADPGARRPFIGFRVALVPRTTSR